MGDLAPEVQLEVFKYLVAQEAQMAASSGAPCASDMPLFVYGFVMGVALMVIINLMRGSKRGF